MRRIAAITLFTALMVSACAGERPADLGVTNGILAICPDSPNCVSSQAVDQRHRIEPLVTGDDPDAAFARLAEIIRRRPD